MKEKLKIKSATENLSVVRQFLKDNASKCGIDSEVVNKIILATDEAVTNIIKHAYKYDENKTIDIVIECSNNKFTIILKDNGEHFDPKNIKDPDLKKYHNEKKVGGLGMFLMKKLMDKVEYKNLKNKGNQLTMTKLI